MFELTDTLTYAVPVMLSVLVAKTVADALEPKGIYDLVIEYALFWCAAFCIETTHPVRTQGRPTPVPRRQGELRVGVHADQRSGACLPHLRNPFISVSFPVQSDLSISFVAYYDCWQADRDVEVVHIEQNNTVKSLRDKLQALMLAGHEDSGFPIVRDDGHGARLVGYIGASELEHALSAFFPHYYSLCLCCVMLRYGLTLLHSPRRGQRRPASHVPRHLAVPPDGHDVVVLDGGARDRLVAGHGQRRSV